MRTLQIMNCKWYNATAWYALYLTKILQEKGNESLLVTIPNSPLIAHAKEHNVPFVTLPLNSKSPKGMFLAFQEMVKICNDFRPDIVNCHRGESFILWSYLKHKFKYKLVRTRGDQRLPKNTFINRYLHNYVADYIVTTNTRMQRHYINELKVAPHRITSILGGVDTNAFYPQKDERDEKRAQYGFTKNDIVLGVIGRLDEIKGQFESVLAFKKALEREGQQRSNLHLVIVGRDCYFTLQSLKEFAYKNGVPKENIHFYSFFDDICEFMNLLDVGVISSVGSETIARVAFEMIACHVPIIGSSVGVMPDILEKDFMFSPANIDEMASLFLKVKDESFRKKVLASNLSRFYGNNDTTSIYGWTMNDFYQKTMHVYENLL